jgi:hypothetical protein
MIAVGCASMWNSGNVTCSILAARALLETMATFDDFVHRIGRHVESKEIDRIHDLANRFLFATRDEALLDATGADKTAENLLDHIDRCSKRVLPIREHYEFLSEWWHPNSSGHFLTYGDLDRQTGTVGFSDRAARVSGIQGHVVTSTMMVEFVERSVDSLDALIPQIAELEVGPGPWMAPDGQAQS